ncbi:MAG: glycoside hydrolase family 78 protein [Planctomycetes bacterium]|nr:glycoside hydrolase family 78 protein [Planctomycetota bacterium]MBU4399304.1 glycoside hydrolase family 78 protein [Planctomycetota bacterium]MCG2685657.1 glycoside hydrolase family 78 protein [Planctomycetales bacterium]
MRVALIAVMACCAVHPASAAESPAAAERLRCEFLVDPLGIDATQPRLCWQMQDARRGAKQTAYQVLVAGTPEKLAAGQGDLWDSGKVASDQSIHVEYAGQPLDSRKQCYWKVRVWDNDGQPAPWSEPAAWTMGLLKPSDWGANWITLGGATYPAPALMVRKEFSVPGAIKRATVSVTGLGLYDLHINGSKVGDRLLAPEWTRYGDRIQYQTYDVTDLLRAGNNAIGAQLSEGWWAGPLMGKSPTQNPRFCLLARLDIELADGSVQSVVSDPSWRATADGPIRRAGIYYGETYDAGKEMPGWDRPGFNAAGWQPVQVLPHPAGAAGAKLVAQRNEPIRATEELRPVKLTEPKPGVYVFDLGQNMVGWCQLKINAPTGTKITLRHAEMLSSNGTIYTANLRTAAQTVEYTLRGGESVLEPHFTYQGFRYVELTGLPSRPAEDAVVGRVIHSAAAQTGKFSCSNDLINQIMRCVEWTQRGNMHSVPTDCPQRDEREGWMGDIQAFAQTAIFNRDMAAFFTKWAPDIRDSQSGDGRYPDVAPDVFGQFSRGTPAWGDAGVVVPWRMYQNYADTRMLQQHFESARRWVEFIRGKNPDLLWRNSRGGDYNDWLNGDTLKNLGYPPGISAVPKEVFATAFFAHSTEIVAKMAAALGRREDAATYSRLFRDIKAAFNKAYVASDGRITGDTQAGYALALHFNLLDESLRPKAVEHLLEAIEKFKGHPSTGIQTTHRMMLELSRNGRHDEACRLINLRTAPSWGYMVEMGATTIWERWDGYVAGRGFQDPSMNSFNHWAFGSVGEWVWRELAGINPDEQQPGYKHFVIHPRPCEDLTWAKGEYDSIHGPILSHWEIVEGRFQLRVEIPANTTATVYLPVADPALVTESGKPAAASDGVKFLRTEGGKSLFEVGAGRYHFAVIPEPSAPGAAGHGLGRSALLRLAEAAVDL